MKGPLAAAAVWLGLLSVPVRSYRYDERYVGYNLNENVTATHPMDYYGKWEPVSSTMLEVEILSSAFPSAMDQERKEH